MKRILLITAILLAFTAASFKSADMCDVCFQNGVNAYTICTVNGGDLATCQAAQAAATCSCAIWAGCGDLIIINCGGGPN